VPEDLSFEVNTTQDSMPDISRLLSKKFTVSRKGYSVDEVREFIFDIELYFNKMLRREADLQLKLADAVKRIESPELDEETLSKAIGIESGKVLKAAHEASKDILAQARLKADEILNEALSALDNSTSTAAVEADKIIEDARTKADSIIQDANNNCLDMLTEAKSAKKRILRDLIERRSVLSRQIRQMQAALETFQAIFADTVTAVDEVNITLLNAEEKAKKSGEEVSLQSPEDAEEAFVLELDRESNGIFTREDLGIELTSGKNPENFDDFLTEKNVIDEIEAQNNQISLTSDIAIHDLDMQDYNFPAIDDLGSSESYDGYFQISEQEIGSDDKDTDIQDHSSDSSFSFPNKSLDILDEESGFRILGAAPTGQSSSQSNEDKSIVNQEQDQSAIVPNANFIKRSDIQETHSQNISDSAVVFIQSKNSADTSSHSLSEADQDSSMDDADQDYRVISLYNAFDAEEIPLAVEIATEEISMAEQGGDKDSVSDDDVSRSDDDYRDIITTDTQSLNEIDAIFAQIRAGRDKEVLKAVSILKNDATFAIKQTEENEITDGHEDAPSSIDMEDVATDSDLDKDIDFTFTDRDHVGNVLDYGDIDKAPNLPGDNGVSEGQNSDSEDKFSGLYEYLKEPYNTLLKRVKRIIRQHQNVILDELRLNWHNAIYDYEKLNITGLDDQDTETITLLLTTVYATSYGFYGKTSVNNKYVTPKDIQTDFSEEAKSLIKQILEPVNMILEQERYGTDESKQSEADFMEHLSLVYRDLRGERLDRIVGDFVVAASCRGIYDCAAKDGDYLKWVMDSELESCPDCEDNSLSSATAVNELFPTGHLMPPAHPGCRCSIRIITKVAD